MRDHDIGDVIVIEHDQVCGIVTDRDIAVRIVAESQDPAATTLATICSHSLLTVTPTDSIEEAMRLMRPHAVRRLPVVEAGKAVGQHPHLPFTFRPLTKGSAVIPFFPPRPPVRWPAHAPGSPPCC